ncbi:hypothetical protein VNI00_008939 [Paramarasmius palmivorus]|uniref:O-methylsterigmatocystin oxidoreductase n=1 Tax=Paramarasmius palmivorus TaxID=297713 RepID=A0AAW0CS65_9AGAR
MLETLSTMSVVFGLVVVAGTVAWKLRLSRAPAPLPPGPKGLPVVGNIFDLPRSQPWLTYSKWAKEYGPIVHLHVPGQSLIIVNDVDYALDMLDKKGRQYSNRPKFIMGGEIVGWDQGPALIQFSKPWSEFRRILAQFLGSRAKVDASYSRIIRESTLELLREISQTPQDWSLHGRRFAASIVLKIAYGYKAGGNDDDLVTLVYRAMDQFSETPAPGAYAVDIFPFLRYLPEWFPGTGWKKQAAFYRETLETMLNRPYEMVRQQMSQGMTTRCVVSDLVDSFGDQELTPELQHTVKWVAAGIYSGGAETTAGVVETFFLAMTLHQDAQRKSQEELNEMLGQGVLPTLADRERLPYTEALILEVFRKYSIGTFGFPHVAVEDVVHDGYYIPKGSIVIANNWFGLQCTRVLIYRTLIFFRLFYHDDKIYANPDKFLPERFIACAARDKELDPRTITFGFGRR